MREFLAKLTILFPIKDEAKSLVEEEIGDSKREDKECNTWFKERKMTTEKSRMTGL